MSDTDVLPDSLIPNTNRSPAPAPAPDAPAANPAAPDPTAPDKSSPADHQSGDGDNGDGGGAPPSALVLLPAAWRRAIYLVYGLLALVGTAMSAYYGALPNLTVPDWVTGGLAVLGALAAPISVLAATNVRDQTPR